MASNDYVFLDHWWVRGTVREVAEVIGDPRGFARWWPAFVRGGEEVTPGDAGGLGAVHRWRMKGWLPYVVRFQTRSVRAPDPQGYAVEAFGDLNGRGVWAFEQVGDWVHVTYDWRVRADRPLLRRFSFLLKPLFGSNHRWAMIKGEESLRLELLRRRAAPGERAHIPPPPGPVSLSPLAIIRAGLEVLRHPTAPLPPVAGNLQPGN